MKFPIKNGDFISMKLTKMSHMTMLLSGLWLSGLANANVADDLTKNYSNIVENCGTSRRPAFLCSGITLRATSPSRDIHVWDPKPLSIQNGGMSFSYIRKDVRLKRLVHDRTSGYIVYPSSLRPTGTVQANTLCSFPVDGWTDERTGAGACGAHKDYLTNSGLCQGQGIYTAEAWFKHYESVSEVNSNRLKHQCGFDVSIGKQQTASIFNESLKAQNLVYNGGVSPKQNEIKLASWATDTSGNTLNPESLPIQAFFYTEASGLADAQYYQQDYYNITKKLIPIVKINFPINDTQDVTFSYVEQDQTTNIAKILTSNFNNIVENCGTSKKPGLLCSGVTARLTKKSDKYHTWDPSPNALGTKANAFTFLRKDINLNRLWIDSTQQSGMIYYPSMLRPADKERQEALCAFPIDGHTGGRKGCGAHPASSKTSGVCQNQGINTAIQWQQHIKGSSHPWSAQCAFNLKIGTLKTAAAFNEAIKAQNLVNTSLDFINGHNEILLALPSLSTDNKVANPEQLAIQAFFYLDTQQGLPEAQYYQQDYRKITGITVPIVKITMPTKVGEDVIFEYMEADQTK